MEEIIKVLEEKCVGCNACIRNCPTNEANVTKMLPDGRFVTTVNHDKCIKCGECIKTCQHGARDYNDDTERYMEDLLSKRTAMLVTPSIKSVFPTTWKGILDWFKKKGVALYDVSFGADICTWAHLRAIEQKKVGNVVTQPCAAIVNYIEEYQPDLITNLSPIHSPISCEAVYVRRYLNVTLPMAVLSPCIAKKVEFDAVGLVDYNVTFKKLKEYFDRNRMVFPLNNESDFEFSFEEQQGQVGSVYPRPGGLRDNLWLHNPEINITTSEGVHKVYPEIDMYAAMPDFKHPEVFDVLSCEFGCNTGPGTGTEQTIFDIMATMRDVEKASKKKRKTAFFNGNSDKQFKHFDEILDLNSFIRTYNPKPKSEPIYEHQLDDVFKSMGKITEKDRHYDCHACGYKSCMEMATAIYRGLNVPDNCIVHAKATLNERHKNLNEEHDQLTSMITKSREFSDNLVQDIEQITESIRIINDANLRTSEKAEKVHGLLEKIIMFCAGYDTMDAETLQQLTGILERVAVAFKSLDENVNETAVSSESISDSVQELTRIVEELNVMLHEALAENGSASKQTAPKYE